MNDENGNFQNYLEQKKQQRNMEADRTTQALDNAAKVAQFTPAAGYAKGYQTFRNIDNKLTGGKVSRGLSKTANAVTPGLKTAGKLGSSGLANTATGAASKIGNKKGLGSNTSSSLPSNSGSKPDSKANDAGSKKKDSSSDKKDDKKNKDSKSSSGSSSIIDSKKDSKKKGMGLFAFGIADGNDDKDEKEGEKSSLEVLFGKITPVKILLMGVGAIITFIILFIVIFINSIENKLSILTSQAFGEIGANAAKGAKSGAKVGNVTKAGDNSYKSDDYDFSDYKEDYVEPTGENVSEVRDNSNRDQALLELKKKFPKEIYLNYYNIGNVFTRRDTICNGDECDSVAEVRFYQKVSDIAYRYKNVYKVELDWPLIVAAVLIKSNNKEETFEANLNNYTVLQVNNKKKIMSLDWEYNYENIPGYEYLSPDDATYDLQLLAKNMVKKKTTQTCTKSNTPSSSDPQPKVTVVKTLESEDVEDYKIEADKANKGAEGLYLVCDTGTKYNIKSTYTLDKDKFDEFLDEYIEKRYYTPGSSNGSGSSSGGDFDIPYGTDLSSTMVNVAASQLGVNEKDGGFYKYWRHYHQFDQYDNIGWCACFVDWVIRNTEYNGVQLSSIITKSNCAPKTFMDFFNSGAAPNIQFHYNTRAAQYSGRGADYTPKPGDIIFYNWKCTWNSPSDPNDKISHVGIVTGFDGSNVHTIEGNTSDMVARRSYPVSNCSIIGYGSWY